MDQLHHQHGLADAGAAEERGLAALRDRRQQIDRLHASRKNLRCPGLFGKSRRRAMYRPTGRIGWKFAATVADPSGRIEKSTKRRFADRNENGRAVRNDPRAACEACRAFERQRAHGPLVEMSLHLRQHAATVARLDCQRLVDRRQGAR